MITIPVSSVTTPIIMVATPSINSPISGCGISVAWRRRLLPLASEEPLKAALQTYDRILNGHYTELMCAKLGLKEKQDEDGALVTDLLKMMKTSRADYTLVFRTLGEFHTHTTSAESQRSLAALFSGPTRVRCVGAALPRPLSDGRQRRLRSTHAHGPGQSEIRTPKLSRPASDCARC